MSKHKKAIIIGICFGLIPIALIATFSSVANAPHSTSSIVTLTTPVDKTSFNMSPKSITNPYVSFSYPAALTQTANGGLTSRQVAAYTFMYRDIQTWNMAIEVVMIPSGNLSDNNGYQFRKVNPQIYQESQINVNNQPVTIMTDSTYGGFSKVAFLVHGQYQAAVSLYGDDPNGLSNLNRTFSMILKSWQWYD